MNDKLGGLIRCPYYIRHGRSEKVFSITCEPIMEPEKLGFEYVQRTGFYKYKDFMDYAELFCCDVYEKCPVYRSILSNREDVK